MLRLLQKWVRRVEYALLIVGVLMLLLMTFVGASDVIGRYFFGRPIKGALEISQLMMAGVALLTWGYTQAVKGHISVEILLKRYPTSFQRAINTLILLLTIFLFGLILWQSSVMAFEVLRQERMLENLPLPMYPFRLFVPLGAAVLCLESFLQLVGLSKEG